MQDLEGEATRPPEFTWLGRIEYSLLWQRMAKQADLLLAEQAGEAVWACEHDPVYTTGRRAVDNRRQVELPAPLVVTDRGGETTFHGHGQLMLYPVLSLRKRKLGVRDYVCLLEHSCIDLLTAYGIQAGLREGLPGVWVDDAKIAAIGLRVSHGIVWHGMALNVSVGPKWFASINACGAGLGVTTMHDFCMPPALADLAHAWYYLLCARLDAPD
jgi:lipoyl(octanoyl) transferase